MALIYQETSDTSGVMMIKDLLLTHVLLTIGVAKRFLSRKRAVYETWQIV